MAGSLPILKRKQAGLAEACNQRQVSEHLHQFDSYPQGNIQEMNESDEQGISRRPNEGGPTILGPPVPVFYGVHEPKSIVLGRASINVFGVDQPKLEDGKKKKSDRKSMAAEKHSGGL